MKASCNSTFSEPIKDNNLAITVLRKGSRKTSVVRLPKIFFIKSQVPGSKKFIAVKKKVSIVLRYVMFCVKQGLL